MIFLLFSILSSTIVALIFKLVDIKKTDLFSVIVINYFTALILGIVIFEGDISLSYIINSDWIIVSLILGVLLIIGFYLIGYSTKKAGIAITSIANRMSVVIPILFSMLYFNEEIGIVKSISVVIALTAVLMAVYRKPQKAVNARFSILPIIMFLVVGLVDSLIKLAQHNYIPATDVSLFTSFSFGVAAIIGSAGLYFRKNSIKKFNNYHVWIFGVVIGAANFGSMYFLIYALNKSGLDSSIVYGANHVGVILLSISLGLWMFREKINKINIIGMALALVAIVILTLFV